MIKPKLEFNQSKNTTIINKNNPYKPITTNSEILEEVKNILLTEKNNNNDCISLFDISEVLKKLKYNYDNIKTKYNSHFNQVIKSKFGNNTNIIIYDFDYKNKILKIGFQKNKNSNYNEISFIKENNQLQIIKPKYDYEKEIFIILNSELSNLYDEFIKYSDYKDDKNAKHNTTSINSKFNIHISQYGTGIFVQSKRNPSYYNFKLFSPSYYNEYPLTSNSNIITEAFRGKETEIFKKIFVKIDNCPKWSQYILYNIRQKQLAEEERILKKQQKKLALKRKIFPFLKK